MNNLEEIVVEEKRENDKMRMSIPIDKEEHDKNVKNIPLIVFYLVLHVLCFMVFLLFNFI